MGGFDENSAGAETTERKREKKRWGAAAAAAANKWGRAPLGKEGGGRKSILEIAFGALLSGS